MKNQMHKLLKKMSWTLATAGSFGLAAEAGAQSSPYHPLVTSVAAANGMERLRPALPEQRSPRETEIKTELAWLASPAIFPYRIEAHVAGSTLEALGYLPTEALHAEALRIAREESGMPVVDGIKIDANLFMPPFSKPAHVLSHDVNETLAQALPACISDITVSVWMQGQVMLQGRAPTQEEKLTASRCLQRVPGCSCVVNQLKAAALVSSRAASAHSANTAQAGGNEASVQGPAAGPESVRVLPPQSIKFDIPTPVAAAPSQNPAATPEKQIIEAAPNVHFPVGGTAILNHHSSPWAPAALPPDLSTTASAAPADGATGAEKQAASPYAFHSTRWRRLDADRGTRIPKPFSTPTGYEAASLPSTSPIIQVAARAPEPPMTLPTMKPIAATTPISQPMNPLPDAQPAEVIERKVLHDDTSPKLESAPKQAEVIERIVLHDDTSPKLESAPKQAPDAMPKHLQQLIASACKKAPKEIELTVVSENKLSVRVKAHSPQECEDLSNRIFGLPELTPYQVALEVTVEK